MSDDLRELAQKAFGAARPSGRSTGASEQTKGGKPDRIVSPDDERGTPYPGDFPNPTDTNYGCF